VLVHLERNTLPIKLLVYIYILIVSACIGWDWSEDGNLSSSWCSGLLERLILSQPLNKFFSFYGTQCFVIVFVRSYHCSLSLARWIQSTPSPFVSQMSIIMYGCETWLLTLREERRPRVCENRVLRIFEPKRDEVTGEWRKLHNEELNDLYFSPHIVRVIKSRRKMGGACGVCGWEERRVQSFGGETWTKETTWETQA